MRDDRRVPCAAGHCDRINRFSNGPDLIQLDEKRIANSVGNATPQAPLAALHKKVDQALVRVGIAPDQRAYLPHITLARLNRSSGPVGNLIEGAGGLSSAPFAVTEFALFESSLTPEGAVYSLVERYPLD